MPRTIKKYLLWLIGLIKTLKNWPEYLLFFFNLIPGDKLIVILRNNLKFIIRKNSGDAIAVLEDFFQHQYCPDPDFFKSKNMIIIDIGAHIGTFSILASIMAKDGKIICYEPDKNNYIQLLKNIELNKIVNIIAYNLAVWKNSGQLKFYFQNDSSLGGSLVNKTQQNYIVDCLTLEDIINKEENCDLLKLDIEGAEYEILFNTPKLTFEKINNIYLEFHQDNKYTCHDLVSFLEKEGFQVIKNGKLNILYAGKSLKETK